MAMVILEGAYDRRRHEHDERAWLAWHVEALSRQKKMPALENFISAKMKRRSQTVAEQIAIAQRWTAAVGGLSG